MEPCCTKTARGAVSVTSSDAFREPVGTPATRWLTELARSYFCSTLAALFVLCGMNPMQKQISIEIQNTQKAALW